MMKKILTLVLSICLLITSGFSVFADSDAKLDAAITYLLEAGKPTVVAALPYFCSDQGIELLNGSLDTYLSGGDAGLFQSVFDKVTQHLDGETLKKLLASMKLVDQSVRSSFQSTLQSNKELSLNNEETAGANVLLNQLVKKNGRFLDVYEEFNITPGALASYLAGAAPLGDGAPILSFDGANFALNSYDETSCAAINALWQDGIADFDVVTFIKSRVADLNHLTTSEKEDVCALFYKTGIMKKTASEGQNGNNGNTPGAPVLPSNPDVNPAVPFTDIEGAWGKAYIEALYLAGVINGVSETEFMPNASITREAFVKLIVELFDLEAADGELPFGDVNAAAWYYPYVKAAYDNGIINGVSEDAFGVGANIKRQDMAKIIDAILKSKGIVAEKASDVVFGDFASVADYAKEAVLHMHTLGIISGDENGNFPPQNLATRQEAAKMIYGLSEAVLNQAK